MKQNETFIRGKTGGIAALVSMGCFERDRINPMQEARVVADWLAAHLHEETVQGVAEIIQEAEAK